MVDSRDCSLSSIPPKSAHKASTWQESPFPRAVQQILTIPEWRVHYHRSVDVKSLLDSSSSNIVPATSFASILATCNATCWGSATGSWKHYADSYSRRSFEAILLPQRVLSDQLKPYYFHLYRGLGKPRHLFSKAACAVNHRHGYPEESGAIYCSPRHFLYNKV